MLIGPWKLFRNKKEVQNPLIRAGFPILLEVVSMAHPPHLISRRPLALLCALCILLQGCGGARVADPDYTDFAGATGYSILSDEQVKNSELRVYSVAYELTYTGQIVLAQLGLLHYEQDVLSQAWVFQYDRGIISLRKTWITSSEYIGTPLSIKTLLNSLARLPIDRIIRSLGPSQNDVLTMRWTEGKTVTSIQQDLPSRHTSFWLSRNGGVSAIGNDYTPSADCIPLRIFIQRYNSSANALDSEELVGMLLIEITN